MRFMKEMKIDWTNMVLGIFICIFGLMGLWRLILPKWYMGFIIFIIGFILLILGIIFEGDEK